MTLPTYPNPLTSLDIATEFQGPSTNIDLNSYHGGSGYVTSGAVGYLNGTATTIPIGGGTQISYGNFHGATNYKPYQIGILVVAGGGAGGAGRRDKSGGAGAGGGGGGLVTAQITIIKANFNAYMVVGYGGSQDFSFEAQPGFAGGDSYVKISNQAGVAASAYGGIGYVIQQGATNQTTIFSGHYFGAGGGGGGAGNSGSGGYGGGSGTYFLTNLSNAGGGGYSSQGGSPGTGAGGGGGGVDDRTHGSYNKGGDGAFIFNAYYGGGGGGGGDGGDGGYNGGAGGGGSGRSSQNGDAGNPVQGGGGGGGASWGNNSWNWGGAGGSGTILAAYPTAYGRIMYGGNMSQYGGYYTHQWTAVGATTDWGFY